MKLKLIYKLSLLLLIFSLTSQIQAKGGKNGSDNTLKKTMQTTNVTKLNINNISTFIQGDGISDVTGSNPGYFYPTLGGMTANFESGFVWGGYVGNSLRVGGSTYRTSLTPGRILDNGTAEDPTGSNVRIFRVRRDYKTGSLTTEVQDEGGSEDAIRAQYAKDWNEWPADRGAPYEDVNHDGRYEPDIDIPGVPGADQTIWWVANDLNTTAAARFYGTVPMGIEAQCTVWGYKSTGALGNMFFKRYIMINKNKDHQDFTKFYVSYWDDIDIGGGSFDFNGCDTTLSLGYIYSGIANNTQYGATPPATGVSFFQGPRIKTGNAQDTAIFKGKYVTGYKNLPMTAYFMFVNSDATFGDPDLNSSIGTNQFYNLMQGFIGSTGQPFVDPKTGKATKFPVSGDPLLKTGWVDGDRAPSDRRMGLASGPFTLAYGDTQEVVVSEISAGDTPGIDNIHAVGVLKQYAKIAQIAYNRFFQLPSAAPTPKLQVSELNQKLILNWGFDASSVASTENYDYNLAGTHYTFQGYNVYQLPSASATLAQAKKIATFDIVDSVTVITDLATDPASGKLLPVVVANGTNSGISRYMVDSVDAFTNSKFLNGSRYYFAVTSYSYNPAPPFGPKVLENALSIVTVTPHSINPGVTYAGSIGQKLSVTHSQGTSDGSVIATVIDPSKTTGGAYTVIFKNDPNLGTVWSLKNGSNVVLDNQTNQSGDNNYIISDGVFVQVIGPQPGVKRDDVNSTTDTTKWGWNYKGDRKFTWAGADPNGYGFEAFGNITAEGGIGCLGWISPDVIFNGNPMVVKASELKNVKLMLANVNFSGDFGPTLNASDPNVSYGYRYLRRASAAAADPRFAPFIKNPVGGIYPFQEFAKNVPLSAWNVDDPKNPKRLAVGFLENNVAGGLVDGVYWPGSNANVTDNTGSSGPREWLFIFDAPYSETVDPVYQQPIANSQVRVMYTAAWNRRNGHLAWSEATGKNQFLIYPGKINTTSDVFTFTAPSVSYSADLAKTDVENINVFPNPYYGVNPQELDKYSRWVTFSHLPVNATIRIFNLAGQLVRTIQKNSNDQFQRWDLMTDNNYPVASGLYIVYIDMPDIGKSKVLKVAIIQEQQILDRF